MTSVPVIRVCEKNRFEAAQSEMALFYKCMQQYARKVLDTADIVSDACFHQLRREQRVGSSVRSVLGCN